MRVNKRVKTLSLVLGMLMCTQVLASSTSQLTMTVEAPVINVTVPVGGLSFHVNPNANVYEGEEYLTKTDFEVTNNSNIGVDFTLKSVKAKEGTTQKVTSTGTDDPKGWGSKRTQEEIIFRFKEGETLKTASTEGVGDNLNITLPLAGKENKVIDYHVVTGLDFVSTNTMNYILDIVIALKG